MQIHPQLEKDSIHITDFNLSQVRLLRDGDNPWFLLIPRKENMIDWSDLSQEDQYQLSDEIDFLCKLIKQEINPDKLNIASLGNMVAQLHIHVIARFKTDRAWPGPIWGTQAKSKFDDANITKWQNLLSGKS